MTASMPSSAASVRKLVLAVAAADHEQSDSRLLRISLGHRCEQAHGAPSERTVAPRCRSRTRRPPARARHGHGLARTGRVEGGSAMPLGMTTSRRWSPANDRRPPRGAGNHPVRVTAAPARRTAAESDTAQRGSTRLPTDVRSMSWAATTLGMPAPRAARRPSRSAARWWCGTQTTSVPLDRKSGRGRRGDPSRNDPNEPRRRLRIPRRGSLPRAGPLPAGTRSSAAPLPGRNDGTAQAGASPRRRRR